MASAVATDLPTLAGAWTEATAVQTPLHFIKIFTEARIRNRMFGHTYIWLYLYPPYTLLYA